MSRHATTGIEGFAESEACLDGTCTRADNPGPPRGRQKPNWQPYAESAALEAQINTAALVLQILAPSSGLGGRIKRQTNEHISYTWLEVIRDYNTSQADDNRT